MRKQWCAIMTDPEYGEVLIRLQGFADAQCLAQAHGDRCLYFVDSDLEPYMTQYEVSAVANGSANK